jgi:hypothetical protein
MARIRTVKPEFFRSRSLSRVSIPARLTFIGLWCEADDHGNGIADTDILKGALWPKADVDVEEHLMELEEEHITLYTVDGERYYSVISFERHQAAAYRRGEAKYPGPDQGERWNRTACTSLHDSARGRVQESAGREGKGEEGRGEEAAGRQVARLKPEERNGIIRAAARIIVNRRTDTRLSNPAYLAAAINGCIDDHRDDAHRHISENPDVTAEALAELLTAPRGERKLPTCSDCRAAFTGHGCTLGTSYLECPMVGPLSGAAS